MWQGGYFPMNMTVTIITWIIIVALIVLLVKLLSRLKERPESNSTIKGEDPLLILKQRLARGEIDEAEYDRLKQRIKED